MSLTGQEIKQPSGTTRSHEAGAGTVSRSIDGPNAGSTPAPRSFVEASGTPPRLQVPEEIAAALISYGCHAAQALKQGWCLCDATDTGEMFIDCDDHDPQRRFKDFQEALDFVIARAADGEKLAQDALAVHRWYAR